MCPTPRLPPEHARVSLCLLVAALPGRAGDPTGLDVDDGPGPAIACWTARSGSSSIWVAGSEGSNATRETTPAGIDADPRWFPDGRRIAFVQNRDGRGDICVVEADGSSPRNLTSDTTDARNPVWSPDGSRIACTRVQDGDWDIRTVAPDGSDDSLLTTEPGDPSDADWRP